MSLDVRTNRQQQQQQPTADERLNRAAISQRIRSPRCGPSSARRPASRPDWATNWMNDVVWWSASPSMFGPPSRPTVWPLGDNLVSVGAVTSFRPPGDMAITDDSVDDLGGCGWHAWQAADRVAGTALLQQAPTMFSIKYASWRFRDGLCRHWTSITCSSWTMHACEVLAAPRLHGTQDSRRAPFNG